MKDSILFNDLVNSGDVFHKVGAATIKERSPIVLFVLLPGVHKRRALLFQHQNCS